MVLNYTAVLKQILPYVGEYILHFLSIFYWHSFGCLMSQNGIQLLLWLGEAGNLVISKDVVSPLLVLEPRKRSDHSVLQSPVDGSP